MRTRQEIYQELRKAYISLELEEKAKTDKEASAEYWRLDLLADIDSDIVWAMELVNESKTASPK